MSNFNFNTPSAANTNFSFGSNSTGFGTAATSANTNFAFTPPQQQNVPNFSLASSATPNVAPAAGLSGLGGSSGFGTGLTATSTGFSGFGTLTKPATAITQPLNFTAPTSTNQPTLNFGLSTGPQTQTSFNFGQSAPAALNLTTNPLTSSVGPTFGAFGTNFASTATTSGGGLFGTTPSSTLATASTGFGVTTTGLFGTTNSVATTQNIGLGGIDTNASQPKTNEGRTDAKVKEAQIPQEIAQTIESLKSHIKQQKSISSDVARTSTRKLFNVSTESQNLNWALVEIANSVETNYAAIKLLRSDTAEAIHEAEMAQRSHDTPAGLQFENTAPLQYFMKIIQKYESDMLTFRKQVESTEKHMRSLAGPQNFTADDLKKGLQQIHESFVALAGRLHETHQKVEIQKEQFLNLRKHLLKDKTNIFDIENTIEKSTNSLLNSGPTPFSTSTNINLGLKYSVGQNNSSWSTGNTKQQQQSQQIGGGFGLGQTTGLSSFGTGFGNTSFSNQDGAFNLQKPPIGTKRNKH